MKSLVVVVFVVFSTVTLFAQQNSSTQPPAQMKKGPGSLDAVAASRDARGLKMTEAMRGNADNGEKRVQAAVYHSGWYVESGAETAKNLNAISCIGATFAAAVGDGGVILVTTDGGKYWSNQSGLTASNLEGISFSDANNGTSVGANGTILRTTDGGISWVSQTNPMTGTNGGFYGVSFTDANNGTAVGYTANSQSGLILHTTNGGTTWVSQASGTNHVFRAVSFTDAERGTAVGDSGTILGTTNGGSAWVNEPNPLGGTSEALYGISYTNWRNGTAVSVAGTILRTYNGGTTWIEQLTNSLGTSYSFYAVSFADSSNGTAVGGETIGADAVVLHTTDAGGSWVRQSYFTYNWLKGVSCTDANHGMMVGGSGMIVETTNGGNTWSSGITSNNINGVSFTDANHGAAVASGGLIIHTTDGGSTWVSQQSGTTLPLAGVSFADSLHGMVVGGDVNTGDVVAVHTTNAGSTWVGQSAGETMFSAVCFTDTNNGTAAGYEGVIYHTTDGGNTWLSQANPLRGTSAQPLGVSFVDANNGAVVASGGNILHTTDGGSTWASQSSGTTKWLYGVSFTDPGTGTAVGQGGTILRTTDGGATWVNQVSGTPNGLSAVCFTDANNGTAVGSAGTIVRTTNGGSTWVSQPSGTPNTLLGVSFTDAKNGTAVGAYGTILRTTTGGVIQYVIAASAGDGGTISPSGQDTVDAGSNPVFTITPYPGYVIENVYIDGNYAGSTSPQTVATGSASHTIIARFIRAFTVTASAAAHGVISPSGTLTIDSGYTQIFAISPDSGYAIDSVFLDNAYIGNSSRDTIEDVTAPHTVHATFKKVYTLTASAGPYGTISPSGTITIDSAVTLVFTITPDFECVIDSVFIDGVFAGNSSPDTIANVNTSKTIFATFRRTPATVPLSFTAGWNIVSFPFADTVGVRTQIFPASLTQAFYFSNGYAGVDTIRQGLGYWLKSSSAGVSSVTAPKIFHDTVAVLTGWNLIGSASFAVLAPMIRGLGTTVSGQIYGYSSGYVPADTIVPGNGYWVEVASAGKLVLDTVGSSKVSGANASTRLAQFSKLKVSDHSGNGQDLYIGAQGVGIPQYALPPVPPAGIFDARFAQGQMAETYPPAATTPQAFRIDISSAAFPITISLTATKKNAAEYFIKDGANGSMFKSARLQQGGAVTLTDAKIQSFEVEVVPVPKQFALEQNYPNPFNPVTTIRYALPEAAQVNLTIYNTLGQQVKTLVNAFQQAGYQSVSFDGSTLASGVYFYKLTADSYSDFKKMVLLK